MPQNIQLHQGRMTVTAPVDLLGAWVLDVRTVDRDHADRPVQAPPACASATATIADCDAAINQLGLLQQVTYQPSARFRRFQLTETALYPGLTTLLIAVAWRRGKRLHLTDRIASPGRSEHGPPVVAHADDRPGLALGPGQRPLGAGG